LRGTRQQTLLDTIKEEWADFAEQTATYLAKIAVLSKRREATMRKVSDINLSNRRAALATETAKQAQQALNDYCVRDLGSDIDLARLEMVEAELVATRAELVKEKALRVKYEAVAHPPKEYFFKSGDYTTKVDLTALEAIADSTSRAAWCLSCSNSSPISATLRCRAAPRRCGSRTSTAIGTSSCGTCFTSRAKRT